MRRTDLQQIEQTCRELAFTMVPSSTPTPPCIFDVKAETELLSSAWDGFWPAETPEPEDFYLPLHRGIWEVLISARNIGLHPAINLVLRGLAHQGIRGPHLELAVTNLLECSPVAVRPDAAGRRVSELAWRRRLTGKIDRLRAAVIDASVPVADLERELDSLVGEAVAHTTATVAA